MSRGERLIEEVFFKIKKKIRSSQRTSSCEWRSEGSFDDDDDEPYPLIQKIVDKKVFGMWRWLGIMLASQFLKEFAEGVGASRTTILSCLHGHTLHRSRSPVNGSRGAQRGRLEKTRPVKNESGRKTN
jgi:hypothetical protein